jgi:hypothetical protein
MRNIILLLLTITLTSSLFGQSELVMKLFELENVAFQEIETPDDFHSAYELKIKQLIDHQNPSKGYFYHRVYLSHKGFDRPTVLVTEGYHRNANRIYELTKLLDANQVIVEHRYFGESIPEDTVDYTYLNLEQATADIHHINELLRQLYDGKWISTGISKGGQTTIYYRYFYPDDVDVSFPYVAPLSLDYEDRRIYEFLDTIGTKKCRKRIMAVQEEMFERRDDLLPRLKWYAKGADAKFTYLNMEQAFEYAILEYPFAFWQWGFGCENVPSTSVSDDSLLQNLIDVTDITFWSDAIMEAYGSHYYQAATEMGYYAYETEDFAKYLEALPLQPHPHAAFTPDKMKVEYEGELAHKVSNWLEVNGNNFIYLYGAIDTWTATAVPPSPKTNSKWFFMQEKHHANARIRNMKEKNRMEIIHTLEDWLEIDIEEKIELK